MIIKEAICLIGSLCESFTKHVLKGKVGKHKGYKDRTTYLNEKNIITADDKLELDWIWDTRSNEHLFLLDFVEFNHYKVSDFNRAREAFNKLCATLTTYRATSARTS
jgi:predicted patatin/cPLA2 family phospholipase